MKLLSLSILLIILLLTSCANEEFSAKKVDDNSNSTNPIQYYSDQRCANFSLIKPEVDFLFLWDNSGSQLFITPETKTALNKLILDISSNFDYRILLAPLLPTTGGYAPMYLVASDPEYLTSTARNMLVPIDQAPDKLGTFPTNSLGSVEDGLNRVLTIVRDNRQSRTGIFRTGAYTMVVIMSNGDDNSKWPGIPLPINEYESRNYATEKLPAFQYLKNSYLHSQQFRFFSIVGHSTCNQVPYQNVVYKTMSGFMHSEAGSPYQEGTTPDSYNICNSNFTNIFNGINSSISYQTIKHVYNYWPIATSTAVTIDPSKITVRKNGVNVPMSSTNGFTYVGMQTNRNTRVQPTPGEPYTGYMIRLNGTARVTYPECMIVDTQTPAEYFGYIHLANKPKLDTIYLTIDGAVIPQSTSNGWQYIGYKDNQNVKILNPSNPNSPGIPPLNKTGYFLRMYGNGIYTNNSEVILKYQPGT